MAFVTWTENALEDLEATCLYIARSAPAAADMFAHRVFEATKQLEQFSAMGRRIQDVLHDEVRELILGNYRIAYRIVVAEVEVLSIHHGAKGRPEARS